MEILIIILFILIVLALLPIVRDFFRRRRQTLPAYTQALSLLLEGKEEEAIAQLKNAVLENTNNIDAYLRLGDLFLKRGETERAIRTHLALSFRKNLTEADEHKIYKSLAQDYLKAERFHKAISVLEELTRANSKDLTSYETLLFLYEKTEAFEEGERLLKRLSKLQKNKKRLSFYYSEFAKSVYKKSRDLGVEYLRAALRHNPKNPSALLALGDYYYETHQTDKAIEHWVAILDELLNHELHELNELNEFIYLVEKRLETAFYDLGRYEEIIRVYQKLLEKNPNFTNLYLALARIYEKKEAIREGIKTLQRFERSKEGREDFDTLLARLTLIYFYLKEGDANRAEKLLEAELTKHGKGETGPYTCSVCKTQSSEFSFRCPKCGTYYA